MRDAGFRSDKGDLEVEAACLERRAAEVPCSGRPVAANNGVIAGETTMTGASLGRWAFHFKDLGWVLPLLFAGCASAGGPDAKRDRSPDAVVGKTWQWESLVTPAETIAVPNPDRYEFRLLADGKVEARFDCNRGGGSYRIGDGQLTFGPLASTRMGCPPGSLGSRFSQELSRVTGFYLDQEVLYLQLPGNGGTLRFRSGEPTLRAPQHL